MKLHILLRVAWMSILLGIIIQIVQFTLAIVLDRNSPIKIFIADFSNKVAWTYVICASIALVSAITKSSIKTGFAGLISTPIGLYLATIIHKAILKELSLDTATAGVFLWTPVIIKAIEYATLGIVFAYLKKNQKSVYQFLIVGFSAGLIFGAFQVIYKISGSALNTINIINLLPLGFNELIIPVGCSIIVFSSEILSKRIKIEAK